MSTAIRFPAVTLNMSVEEARALSILINTCVKGNRDPVTQALFEISEDLKSVGIDYKSDYHYVTFEAESSSGERISTHSFRDFNGISFRGVPADVLSWTGDDGC